MTITIETAHKQGFEAGDTVRLVMNELVGLYRVTSETRIIGHLGIKARYTYVLAFLRFDK